MALLRLCALLGATPVLLAGTLATASAQAPYRIGPGDSLSVSIYGQPELSGAHTVRSNGEIVLHLLGAIPAAGLDLHQLETQIVEKAAAVFQTAPSVVVDIARYRDVFVLGAVARPGVYPFVPGMTVTMAVAKAGGLQRAVVAADSQAVRLLGEQRQVLLSRDRIARLEDELTDLDREIAGIRAEAPAAEVGPRLSVRRQLLEAELRGIEQTTALAQREADALERSRTLLESRLERAETALADARSRSDGGYFPPERLEQLQDAADRLREDLLDTLAASARAQRLVSDGINGATLARIRHLSALVAEKSEAEATIARERIALQTSVDFVSQFGAPQALEAAGLGATERFVVTRRQGERMDDLEAAPASPLQPEDVLTVEIAYPAISTE